MPSDGRRFLPPPRRVPLAAPEDWIADHGEHGHICGVGTSHRPGAPEYRRCECGQWYMWSCTSWVRVKNPGMRWNHEHRVDDFFNLGGDSWAEGDQSLSLIDHLVIRWRMLRMLVRELTGH